MAAEKTMPDDPSRFELEAPISAAESKRKSGRERLGFRDGERGVHSSRTIMLTELSLLLESTVSSAEKRDYRQASAVENVVEKRTQINREHTTRKLKAMYGLDPSMAVFRGLRHFWQIENGALPQLAMLCALARDPLLRLSVDAVLDLKVGDTISAAGLAEVVRQRAPGRFSETNEKAIAVRMLSSWAQSGHLTGHLRKSRARPYATPVVAAYAMLIGYLEGIRAQRLFGTLWARVVDRPVEELVDLVAVAGQRGLLDFRQVSSIVEVRFRDFLTRDEEEWAREQG